MVKIIPRAEWGAKSPTKTIYSAPRSSRTGFAVHHGVGSGGSSPEVAKSILRGYQRLHIGNGWGDLGYNFAIDKWGNIYQGRGLDAIGAHAGGANTANIGAVLIGDSRNGDLTAAAKAAFQELYAWVCDQVNSKLAERCHSDINRTDCPSDPARTWVKNGGLTRGVTAPPSPKPPTGPRPEPTFNGYKVREIQSLLGRRGFPTAVDGVYGPDTRRQVKNFQRQQRIAVDGIVGKVTWSYLNVPRQPVRRPTIRRGSRGTHVKYAQQRLGGLKIDGIFGPQTEARTRRFQSLEKITIDGIIGPVTWSRLGG